MAHVIHEQQATASSLPVTASTPARQGDHERLFHLLEEDGPAPVDFMLYLSDPVIDRENVFEDFEEEA